MIISKTTNAVAVLDNNKHKRIIAALAFKYTWLILHKKEKGNAVRKLRLH
jgi:hypothetical protein